MKKIFLLFTAVAFMALSGCNGNDNDNTPSMKGTWSLTNVHGGITGSDDSFDPGMITWDFDPTSHTVTIVNNNTFEAQDILPSGTYDYSVVENTTSSELCSENIVVGGTNYGCFAVSAHEMTFAQVESDGFMITFVR
jgi:hypothetical protein